MEAALAGFDEADAEADGQRLAGERGPPPGDATEAAAVVETQEPDRQLQRAGLQQRLHDLQAKQRRVQGALDAQQGGAGGGEGGGAAEGKAAEEARAAVALLEDGGLDEELNAAGSSAMVETERDRLIRLVRRARPCGLPAGRRLHSCNRLRHPLVAAALWGACGAPRKD